MSFNITNEFSKVDRNIFYSTSLPNYTKLSSKIILEFKDIRHVRKKNRKNTKRYRKKKGNVQGDDSKIQDPKKKTNKIHQLQHKTLQSAQGRCTMDRSRRLLHGRTKQTSIHQGITFAWAISTKEQNGSRSRRECWAGVC